MWLGPVFQAELLTSSRRARFYFGRTLYGLLVLAIVTSVYRSMTSSFANESEIPIREAARFGQAIFAAFASLQGMILLVMTPALVAGAIADEKQRKTLHYLMASRLSSTEIVLGKMAARLLRVAILGAIGLPVLALISLFGGVNFVIVLVVYGATATTTFFLASLSILCSAVTRKPRDAIMQAFFYEILWLSVAPLMLSTMSLWEPFWQHIGEACRPALEWVAASSPTNLLRGTWMLSSPDQVVRNAFWMMGTQAAYGSAFLVVAIWRLRPAFRGQDDPSLWARLFRRQRSPSRWRIWARPECGDDAMLWKEMYLHRTSDLRRVVYSSLGIVTFGFLIYSFWDLGKAAAGEVYARGYWDFGPNQREINGLLRGANAVAMVIILFGLSSVAASSVTSERENDTWVNLASSPLSGTEILRGKVVGALWLFRPLGYMLAGSWLFGLLIGSVHPLGVVASLVELGVFAWFVAALGVTFSLRSRNTIQALGLTIGTLFCLNAGILLFFALLEVRTLMVVTPCMPAVFTISLVSVGDLRQHWSDPANELFCACTLGTLVYALGAFFLSIDAVRRFDRVVDRPNRLDHGSKPRGPEPAAPLATTG